MQLSSTSQSRNGRNRKVRADQATSIQPDEADIRYVAALSLVEAIDRDLQKGTRHYYDTAGNLLISLDEVIQAILSDTLVVDKPVKMFRDRGAVQWSRVGELVA